jgi:hypothetical protein
MRRRALAAAIPRKAFPPRSGLTDNARAGRISLARLLGSLACAISGKHALRATSSSCARAARNSKWADGRETWRRCHVCLAPGPRADGGRECVVGREGARAHTGGVGRGNSDTDGRRDSVPGFGGEENHQTKKEKRDTNDVKRKEKKTENRKRTKNCHVCSRPSVRSGSTAHHPPPSNPSTDFPSRTDRARERQQDSPPSPHGHVHRRATTSLKMDSWVSNEIDVGSLHSLSVPRARAQGNLPTHPTASSPSMRPPPETANSHRARRPSLFRQRGAGTHCEHSPAAVLPTLPNMPRKTLLPQEAAAPTSLLDK